MESIKRIAIGSDHAGYELKKQIIDYLKESNFEVIDFGASSSESVDYPDHVHPLAKSISGKKSDLGILICGTGNGVAMTANKYENIRCGLCWNSEIAQLIREHNDANILALPARFVTVDDALEMVKTFLSTPFEGGRHQRRIDKISNH